MLTLTHPYMRLTVIFVLAVLLFIVIRFDADALVRDQIESVAVSQGLTIQMEDTDLAGLDVTLKTVSITSGWLPAPLYFDEVGISPEILSSITSQPSAEVELRWRGIHAQATVSRSEGMLALQDIRADADAATWLQSIAPFLSSTVQINADGMLNLEGELMLHAHGAVQQRGNIIASWPVTGDITINSSKAYDPALLAWLPEQEPGLTKPLRMSVSGPLSRPRLAMQR